ncbi:MAG: hypothetical protein EXS09_05495 [Gemmataceae bacterium]|nr:hypothetical protein [Gemmataceae bacterium]
MESFIAQYEADAKILSQAIAGLSCEELTSFPIPGTWSIQQVIMHVLDSDLIASDRMKRVIAGPTPPTLMAYDETLYAQKIGYHHVDAKLACDLFRLNRLVMAQILRNVPDAAWSQTGNHTERGVESLALIVQLYVDHPRHHLKFIEAKRKMLGK